GTYRTYKRSDGPGGCAGAGPLHHRRWRAAVDGRTGLVVRGRPAWRFLRATRPSGIKQRSFLGARFLLAQWPPNDPGESGASAPKEAEIKAANPCRVGHVVYRGLRHVESLSSYR